MDEAKRDLGIIKHILAYCNAATMCILQIGELAGHLSETFKAAHPTVPWRSIKAMRNVAAHEYGSISIPDVWDTITNDIPKLKAYCQKVLAD